MAKRDVATEISRLARERILVLDGAWGTMLPGAGLRPEDYRGPAFAALVEGGVDVIMLETIFDTLNAKAAITAARETAPSTPLWISATIVDLSGRTLSGQTIEAVWTSIEHADPLIVGVNCSLGAKELRPYVAELARIAPCLVSAHPNAGLPNAFGGYDETPEVTSTLLHEFASAGLLNIAGSCCGSTPEHTRAIADSVRGLSPRPG